MTPPTLASPTQIPDQTGRTVIVTGGSSGIGLATATALSAKGARVILAVRDLAKGRTAAARVGGHVDVRLLDLASLASVRAFAEGVDAPVDLLINNAGMMTDARRLTEDGFELQFGTNHLGPFALTNLLLDRIVGRVVTVTSGAHRSARIDFDDLQWERRTYSPFGAYGQSKLANLLFTAELQRRLNAAGSPVLSTAAHPGWASTGFTVASGNRILDSLTVMSTAWFAQGPEGGALPTLLAATGDIPGDSLAGPSRFGVRGPATLDKRSAAAQDPATAARLWEVSAHLTNTRFPLGADSAS